MKKVQTLALALALVALGSVSWAATSLNSSRVMQKKPPDTAATNLNSSRSNIYRVKVTKVNPKDNTFTVEVTFSAKAIPLPKKEERVDVTYKQTTPDGPLEATTVNSAESNASNKVVIGPGPRGGQPRNEVQDAGGMPIYHRFKVDVENTSGMFNLNENGTHARATIARLNSDLTGKVTQVNPKNKTFTVEVTFSAKKMKDPPPEVGKIYDVTFTQPTPGGPLEATTVNSSKSNSFD